MTAMEGSAGAGVAILVIGTLFVTQSNLRWHVVLVHPAGAG